MNRNSAATQQATLTITRLSVIWQPMAGLEEISRLQCTEFKELITIQSYYRVSTKKQSQLLFSIELNALILGVEI